MTNDIPKTQEYGRFAFPIPSRVCVNAANGKPIVINIIDRGLDPVCRLTLMWAFPGVNTREELEPARIMVAMLREGSRKFDGDTIADTLDGAGAWIATTLTPQAALLNLYCMNDRLERLLPLIAEMVMNPTFPASALNKVKENKRDSLRRLLIRPAVSADFRLADILCGPRNPASWTLTAERIENVDLASLTLSHQRLLEQGQLQIWLAGRISDKTVHSVESFSRGLKQGENAGNQLDYTMRTLPDELAVVEMPFTKQAAVSIGFSIFPAFHPQFAMQSLVVRALGGYFGSRLNLTLREEKGYTYGVFAHVVALARCAYCNISTQTTPDNVEPLLAEARKVIDSMRTQKATWKEIEALRRYCLGRIATIMESPFSVADYHLSQLIQGTPPDYMEAYQDAIFNLTPWLLQKTARDMEGFDRLRVVKAGAFAKKDKQP